MRSFDPKGKILKNLGSWGKFPEPEVAATQSNDLTWVNKIYPGPINTMQMRVLSRLSDWAYNLRKQRLKTVHGRIIRLRYQLEEVETSTINQGNIKLKCTGEEVISMDIMKVLGVLFQKNFNWEIQIDS